MTQRLASHLPPADLDALQADLVELALGSAIKPDPGVKGWLQSIAVVRPTDADAVVADEDWLACALPAASAVELLTRTLLRDPRYRLHVDVALAEIVVAVGLSRRWSRLEALLFGELAILAPRFAALAELAKVEDSTRESAGWRRLDPLPAEIASMLDQRCWGISGTPEALFPVLRTRYPAFAVVPVFHEPSSALVRGVVAAAAMGEGVRVADQQQAKVVDLARQGVPLWWQPRADGQLEVTLSAPCRVRGEPRDFSTHAFSRGVPAHVRAQSALLPRQPDITRAPFWQIVETATAGLAFVGASSRHVWPPDRDAARRGLPHGEHLADLIRSRPARRGAGNPADDALRMLADHPLYGFWIQMLLMEALDRELGEETLLFAPPTHAIVQDVEAATRVYYRPRPDATQQVQPALELGGLDHVMTRVASAVSLRPVAVLGDPAGPWAMSLALLARVGIAQTRHDRWALSIHALDRLHGGGLMTGVIRRGKDFREHLHAVLEALWRERAATTPEVCSA